MSRDADELAKALEGLTDEEPTIDTSEQRRRPPSAPRSNGRRQRPAAPIEQPPSAPSPARPSAPKLSPTAHARVRAQSQTVELKRTLIPPLMTMGVALLICGVAWFVLPDLHPLRLAGSPGLAFTLIGVAVLCLGLTVVNMLGVKKAIG
ncbi:MAG: hypothetical protein AAGD32_09845 [Planctomycetota bacterium]